MKGSVGLAIAVWCLGAGSLVSAAKEKPPLIERLESVTGLELTQNQREKIADLSRAYAEEIAAMHAAFLADIGKVVGLSQKTLRDEVFSEMGPPFDVDEERRGVIERLTERYLSFSQKRSIDEIVSRWQGSRVRVEGVYAQDIASVTDVPAEKVLEFLNKNEQTRRNA